LTNSKIINVEVENGLLIVELSNIRGHFIICPIEYIKNAAECKYLEHAGNYIAIGQFYDKIFRDKENNFGAFFYNGIATSNDGSVIERVNNHKKDFPYATHIIFYVNQYFHKEQIEWIENKTYICGIEGNWTSTNNTTPSFSKISKKDIDYCEECFSGLKFVLKYFNLDIFEKRMFQKQVIESSEQTMVKLQEIPEKLIKTSEIIQTDSLVIDLPKNTNKLYHYNTNSKYCIEMFDYFVNNNVLMIWENPKQKEMIVNKINKGDIFVVYRNNKGYVGVAKSLTKTHKSEIKHVKTDSDEYSFDIEWIRKPNENLLDIKELPFVYQTTCCNIKNQKLINILEKHFKINFSDYCINIYGNKKELK